MTLVEQDASLEKKKTHEEQRPGVLSVGPHRTGTVAYPTVYGAPDTHDIYFGAREVMAGG